jgi:hypothetical protein
MEQPRPGLVGEVLWLTDKRPRKTGEAWSQLAERFPSTGLWPLILEGHSMEPDRPWDEGEFDPSLSSDPADHDALEVERSWWAEVIPSEQDLTEAPEMVGPFGREFPGLAPSVAGSEDSRVLKSVAEQLEGRLGLVPAIRPADTVAALGWQGPANYFSDMGLLAAVLRSWEERFGAYLVGIGFDTLTIAVTRPPKTLEHARAVAAEHFAVCPDNIWQNSESFDSYAADIKGRKAWQFWWD